MKPTPLKVLLISRAWPPVVGGIEKHNAEIARALSLVADVDVIANPRGKKWLPLFFIYALLVSLVKIRRCDVVLLGDGVLAPLGFLLKRVGRKPVVCVLHGLDITYDHPVYQSLWINRFLPVMDRYIAVGNETIRQGVKRGLDQQRFVFIGNGVEVFSVNKPVVMPVRLAALIEGPGKGPVILTLGRLVRRKGVEWFVRHVMPLMPVDVCYLVAGDGRERSSIERAIMECGLQGRVIMLGAVSEEEKAYLFYRADIFVQPNIKVDGDMEGFGLVVLEAAASGCVVVASALEGLQDAIHDGCNGWLVESGNAEAYAEKLQALLSRPDDLTGFGQLASVYVQQHFSWQGAALKYLQVLEESCQWAGAAR